MPTIVDRIKDVCEGKIDFQGQKTAERAAQLGLTLAAVIAFVVGLSAQDIRVSLAVYALGALTTAFVVVPPWKFLNRHKVEWRSTAVAAKKDA